MLRPLIIDDQAKREAARVISHAEQHHYRPGIDPIPGDDDRYVARLGTYLVVFTFTHAEGLIWRHLSVSVPSDKYPNPFAVFAIAQLFGFTGYDESKPDKPGEDWRVDVSSREHCVLVVQPVASNVPKEAMQ